MRSIMKSTITHSMRLAAFLALITVAACRTSYSPPVETLNTLAAVGRVIDKQVIPADGGMSTVATVPVRAGGAMLFIPAFSAPIGRRPAHYIYEVRASADAKRYVRAAFPGEIPVGACVEVWTEPSRTGAFTHNYGYVVLKPSDGC
jgi:hypothetical protein